MNKLTPNLMVEDVRKTTEYYVETFGFKLEMAVPDSQDTVINTLDTDKEIVYSLVKNGSVEIMFQSSGTLRAEVEALKDSPIGLAGTIYIEVDDLDSLYYSVKDKTTILKQPFTTWYGVREFYVQDINGYVLTFAQAVSEE